jgi:CheY-like chemotaxis protein
VPQGVPEPVHILLVEDDQDSRESLSEALRAEGYSVVTAGDGQQALDLLEDGVRPSLVLMDLKLPRVSGWDILKYLHTEPRLRHVPAIVVTGVPKDTVKVVADAVFEKPLDHARLFETIRHLVAR